MAISSDGAGTPEAALDQAVIVALGCNDKGGFDSCTHVLEHALAALADAGIVVAARSSWWRSAAWPDPSDPPFVNGVALIETRLGPGALMAVLTRIEDAFGRVRDARNAPRILDLDLIAHGRARGVFDGVTLPHPRAVQRRFVMGPLAQIAPGWTCPGEPGGAGAVELAARATVGRDAAPIG